MSPLLWSILLLLFGLTILVTEFFVPSSGLLGLLSALSLIGSIVMGFWSSQVAGMVMMATELVLVPLILVAAVKYWPMTPIGKAMLIPQPDNPDDVLPETEGYRGLEALVGRYGVSKSLMMPGGVISIEGRNYDALSEGNAIDPGECVLVVDVSTQRLIVRREEPEVVEEKQVEMPKAEKEPVEGAASPFEDPLV